MPDIKVRRLPDWVVAAHKLRADRGGRSLEEELRVLLTDAAIRPQQDCAAEILAFRDRLRSRYGSLSDSTPHIRQDREARG